MSIASAYNSAADQIARMEGIAQANNAHSAQQATIQREWQEQQNAKAMAFNRDEAAKNRDWQELMSNTAHQREVKDLIAAGLNPVLSATGGNGAAVGSGATAAGVTSAGAKGDTDTSTSGAIANLLGSVLSAQTQLEAANINAKTQEAVADKYNAMSHIVAQLQAETSRYATDQSAATGRYAADRGAVASAYSANQHYAAAQYQSDRSKYGAAYNLVDGLANIIGMGNVSQNTSTSNAKSFSSAVDKAFGKLENAVKANDGYPLITKPFPSLKNTKLFGKKVK